MDMQLYALLKKDLEDFEYVGGFKIVEVKTLPDVLEEDVIYIVNPNKKDDE
jgi:hypothetical protein